MRKEPLLENAGLAGPDDCPQRMNITMNSSSSKSADSVISSLAIPRQQKDSPGSRGFPDVEAAGANIPRRGQEGQKSFFLGTSLLLEGALQFVHFLLPQDFLLYLVFKLLCSQY